MFYKFIIISVFISYFKQTPCSDLVDKLNAKPKVVLSSIYALCDSKVGDIVRVGGRKSDWQKLLFLEH